MKLKIATISCVLMAHSALAFEPTNPDDDAFHQALFCSETDPTGDVTDQTEQNISMEFWNNLDTIFADLQKDTLIIPSMEAQPLAAQPQPPAPPQASIPFQPISVPAENPPIALHQPLNLDSSETNNAHQQAKQCPICHATIKDRGTSAHMRTHFTRIIVDNSRVRFRCLLCAKLLIDNNYLYGHAQRCVKHNECPACHLRLTPRNRVWHLGHCSQPIQHQ